MPSNNQILKVLVNHVKDVPAIVQAATALASSQDWDSRASAAKSLIDALLPVVKDIDAALQNSPLMGAEEEESIVTDGLCGQAELNAAGIDWDQLVDLLPLIKQVVEALLALV